MALPKKPKRCPAEGELPFAYDWKPGHSHLKQRQRGFDEATYVESFLALNALGGACLEVFDRLREHAEVICACAE